MTVSDLIKQLSKLPESLPVKTEGKSGGIQEPRIEMKDVSEFYNSKYRYIILIK
jgi:hypothetical protein